MVTKAEHVTFTCDYCGKEKTVPKRDFRGKCFHTCSIKCKHGMMGIYMNMKWENLPPKKRDEWLARIRKNGRGLIAYHKALRPEKVAKVIKYMENIRPATRNQIKGHAAGRLGVGGIPTGVCTLIAAHHEMLKDDPERLSTEFMEKICGVDCKCKVKRKGDPE